MAFTDTWNATFLGQPADSEDAKLGAGRIRSLKTALDERLKVDHSMAGDANDGAHKKITLLEQAADPTNAANTGFLYTKDVGGKTELFYEDESGTVSRVVKGGADAQITSMTGLTTPTDVLNPVRVKDALLQTMQSATTGGTSTAFTVTIDSDLALTTDERFRVKFHTTAGSAPTLNRDGKGAKALMLYNLAGVKVAASAATIIADMLTDVEYDGTDYIILNPLPVAATIMAKQSATGASITFSSIPSGVREVVLMFESVSTNGTDNILVQLGDAGGLETTGYLGACSQSGVGGANFTSAFGITPIAAAGIHHGSMILTLMDASTNTWIANYQFQKSDSAPNSIQGAGSKSLSATLTQIGLSFSGANNFDGGNIGLQYRY